MPECASCLKRDCDLGRGESRRTPSPEWMDKGSRGLRPARVRLECSLHGCRAITMSMQSDSLCLFIGRVQSLLQRAAC